VAPTNLGFSLEDEGVEFIKREAEEETQAQVKTLHEKRAYYKEKADYQGGRGGHRYNEGGRGGYYQKHRGGNYDRYEKVRPQGEEQENEVAETEGQ